MINKNEVIVTEIIKDDINDSITNPIFDGYNITKYRELLLEKQQSENVDFIMSNIFQSISYFKNPKNTDNQFQPIKILCLGKVQSGKTSFFLGSIALAFDNGYDVAYVLGGTKLKLKEQNLNRIVSSFANNEKIKVLNVDNAFNEDVASLVKQGFKIILVILKNASKNTNLGMLKKLSKEFGSLASVVVDDEGDEFTPGAERARKRNTKAGKTHDKIVEIITSFNICTFLSVTATPQANLLISTFDGISPDRLVLVRPGKGYTGGHAFFDTKDNSHVYTISDSDDFVDSIPDTFKNALYFFIFGCCLRCSINDYDPISMLVHPSSSNAVQNIVGMRINNFLNTSLIPAANFINSIQYDDLIFELKKIAAQYSEMNGLQIPSFDLIFKQLPHVINNLSTKIINYGTSEDYEDKHLYKIYIGGNMLGRGLTIDRLTVSYIYRDSKEAQVDTMYQRCRWFGYKQSYFDLCKVYMTSELKSKFMAIVSNEDHMWNSMEAFLDTQIDLKKFKRIFLLENNKLILTRKSVANTVTMKIISSGNIADECIDLSEDEKNHNREIYQQFIFKYEKFGKLTDFDTSSDHKQRHLILKISFIEFYNEFLSKLIYGYGSHFSASLFKIIVEQIQKKQRPDEIIVMLMRYKRGEYRSPSNSTRMNISRLFQGRNSGTNFTGDRYPTDIYGVNYSAKPFIQIHMVDINNKEPIFSECIPLISYNNPLTSEIIKMVTGDNVYED